MSNTSLLGSYGGQAGDGLFFRNRIVNGCMRIDQRNSGAAATITANASSVYTLDRWRVFSAGSNATAQRVAGSGSNQYALRITGLASNTGTVLEQRIEAANCYDLVNNTVTVSFQVSSTSITSLNWSADYSNGGVDSWSGATAIASGSVTISSTNNTYSFTFNAGANVVNGLRITFTTGALLGSQTITYQQIQAEAGQTATPFERRPIGMELSLCQRYCFVNRAAQYHYIGIGGMENTNICNVAMVLPQIMRTAPTLESYANPSSIQFEYTGGMATGYTAMALNGSGNSTSYRLQFFGGTGGTTGAVGAVRSQVAEVKAVISAEL